MLARLVRSLAVAGAYIAAASIIFLAVGITTNVVGRAMFGYSVRWMLQASEYALIVMTFAGASWVLLEDKHIRVDIVFDLVSERTAALLILVCDLLGFVLMAAMTWYSFVVIFQSKISDAIIYEYIELPEWWIFTGLPFGFGLMTAVFLLRLLKSPIAKRTVNSEADRDRSAGNEMRF